MRQLSSYLSRLSSYAFGTAQDCFLPAFLTRA